MLRDYLRMITCLIALEEVRAGRGPKEITLSEQQMNEIVFIHNKLRESVLSSNIRKMSWDQELARISRNYGQKCQFSHNTQANHSKFENSVGENIYVSQRPVKDFETTHAIQMWFDEKKDFDYTTRKCQPKKKCGHYTQVVWAKTYKVGCSLTMCDYVSDFNRPEAHLFICNYSPAGNVYSYTSGGARHMMIPFLIGPACSKCETATDKCDHKLCANPSRDFPAGYTPILNQDEETHRHESNHHGLVTAVVVLSLVVVALLAYIIYRERVRLNLVVQMWKTKSSPIQHKTFSNQNTPCVSRSTTPRHSLVTLHGIGPPQPVGSSSGSISKKPPRLDISPPKPSSSPYKPGRPPPPPFTAN